MFEIPMKLPSLNDFIKVSRGNKFASAKLKKDLEYEIGLHLLKVPKIENPIKIHFIWVEGNKRRDLDNVAFAKKFIIDSLVKLGRLKDDNRNCVVGFSDSFEYGKEFKVLIQIEEV